jgi:Metal binding domain of Ada
MLDVDCCYQAVLTHDVRFDGVFFIGVSTTRIYCRTVCPAKTPQQKNYTFYPSAAAAEQALFRPCLRCRSELAPGKARIDATGRLASAVARTLTHLMPTAEQIAQTDIKTIVSLGILRTRAKSILALAQAILVPRGFANATQALSLNPGCQIDQTIAQLQTIPGIGVWTAHYIAMRVLADPDIFLHTDLGIRQAFGETNPKCMLAIAAQWQPWRSYATFHLWQALKQGNGLIPETVQNKMTALKVATR